jgi:hypothetical protein
MSKASRVHTNIKKIKKRGIENKDPITVIEHPQQQHSNHQQIQHPQRLQRGNNA